MHVARGAFAVGAVAVAAISVALVAPPHDATSAPSADAASRLFDRKFVCPVTVRAGIAVLEVRARAGVRQSGARSWSQLPAFQFYSGSGNTTEWSLVGASAGVVDAHTFFVDDKCRTTSRSAPLNRSGLDVAAVVGFDEEAFECNVGKRVLLHVRAAFRSPATLSRRLGVLTTNVAVKQASVSVRTLRGQPIAFSSVSESGRVRLGTAAGCFPD